MKEMEKTVKVRLGGANGFSIGYIPEMPADIQVEALNT